MVFEETITIECFLAVWPLPSMVFRWFLIFLPSLSMVFDGSGPLVQRCDGFDGSSWSNLGFLATSSHSTALPKKAKIRMIRFILNLESCLIFTTLTQPVKNLILYSRWANRSGEIGHDEHCIYFFLFSQDGDGGGGGGDPVEEEPSLPVPVHIRAHLVLFHRFSFNFPLEGGRLNCSFGFHPVQGDGSPLPPCAGGNGSWGRITDGGSLQGGGGGARADKK